MLIFSWNVAGLSQTLHRIHEAYGPKKSEMGLKPAADKKLPPSASLLEYFKRHHADIVCFQEHKIPLSQLSSRSEPRGCSTVEGYDSFWSCCVGKNQRGFNGVCTYAKKGMVVSANSSPLGDPELDGQGRCVMTDHGNFVLFNVYVPAMGGQSLSFRMKFLRALREAMRHQREECNKQVMLVGDLNIAHTSRDRFWKDRTLHVQDVLDEVARCKQVDALAQWKTDVATNWNKIKSCMETMEAVPTQTTNTTTGEKFDKFRLRVDVDNRRVFLGKHESSPDHCLWQYDFRQCTYLDGDSNQEVIACEENAISVGTLTELMAKIAGVEWSEALQRLIASTDAGVPRTSPSVQWLNDLINEDNMVDTFRSFYPTAEARFTCWHQFTNRRYENEGIRLDYTIVDKSLMNFVEKGDVTTLRCCGTTPEDPLSELAALVAATANGRFKPVSFQGEGIGESSQEALDSQFGSPHTGIIYTPPSFSDHVAISVLLNDSCCKRDLVLNERHPQTKKAQPHKAQKSIVSFFSTKNTSVSSNRIGSSVSNVKTGMSTKGNSKVNGAKQKQETSFKSFFTPKRMAGDSSNEEKLSHTKRPKLGSSKQQKRTVSSQPQKQSSNSILHHFAK